MDRGGEYRYLLGLPGGTKHPMYAQVEEAATAKNFQLEVGKGNEGDTIGRRIVYVYDTATFPFYQAEVYHQFHDDFQSPAYGKKYNSLAQMAFDDGRLKITGCPDRVAKSFERKANGEATTAHPYFIVSFLFIGIFLPMVLWKQRLFPRLLPQ
mmetsp:Transcript_7166/g.9688  ORF Transcript_7166/g.9688 Transcript_7166/m.9688 type:complete len:153 (+) Transcript_7166:692-1150(+)